MASVAADHAQNQAPAAPVLSSLEGDADRTYGVGSTVEQSRNGLSSEQAPAAPAETGPAAQGGTGATTNPPAGGTDGGAGGNADSSRQSLDGPPKNPLLAAYDMHYSAVKADPSDFSKWVSLISASEKLGDMAKLREVYDSFFAEYPLCFGYWKKYADAELRNNSVEAAAAVYERGVAAVPYSVDLWGHYATFRQTSGATSDAVESVFERGLGFVAGDYAAHGLWDKYLAFLMGQNDTLKAAQIYRRILGQPLKELDRYYESLQDFVHQRPASQVVPDSDRGTLEVRAKEAKLAAAAAAQQKAMDEEAAATAAATPQAVEGRAADSTQGEPPLGTGSFWAPAPAVGTQEVQPVASQQDGSLGDHAAASGVATAPPSTAAASSSMQVDGTVTVTAVPNDMTITDEDVKAAWLADCERIYKVTKEELARRKPFQDAIKRPYFHVKPLDASQLSAWSRFLDYVEGRGDDEVTVHLYERCLVACAEYPEFWARYIRFLEPKRQLAAQHAVQRAQGIHCKSRPEMQQLAARFHERHGSVAAARAAHRLVLDRLAPGLVSAVLAYSNFERRQGNKDAACKAFDDALSVLEQKGQDGENAYVFLTVSYAHFLYQAYKDTDTGRALYETALQRLPGNKTLWEGAIHFEETVDASSEEKARRALSLYAKAASAVATADVGGLPEDVREDFSARAAVFADLCGTASMVEAAERLHAARFKPTERLGMQPSAAAGVVGQKRPADIAAADESPAVKQPRMEPQAPVPAPTPAAPPVTAAAPTQAVPAAPAAAPAAPAAGYYPPAAGYTYPAYYPTYQYPAYSYPQY